MTELVAHVMPYALGDAPAGIASKAGKAFGYDANIRTCLSNDRTHRVIVLAHYGDWWKHGYVPKPGTKVPRKPIEQLTVDQVDNLWSTKDHHPIITGTAAVDLFLAARLVPCFEMKPSIWTAAAIQDLVDHADNVGLPIVFMTIQSFGKTARARAAWEAKALERMTLVHGLEQNSMLLYRHRVDWARWGPVLTAIKGHPGNKAHNVVTASTLVKQLHKEIPVAKQKITASPKKLIDLALEEVGFHEGRAGSNWNNHQKYSPAVPGLEWSQNQAWCATFMSWLALKAGLSALFPRTASCDAGWAWFKDPKNPGVISDYPVIGGQVFFGTPGDKNHTGLVVDFDATYVWSIEGNTNTSGSPQGDGVYKLKHRRKDPRIQGYGVPAFKEGIVSADPALAGKAPKPPTTTPIKPPTAAPATSTTDAAILTDLKAVRDKHKVTLLYLARVALDGVVRATKAGPRRSAATASATTLKPYK